MGLKLKCGTKAQRLGPRDKAGDGTFQRTQQQRQKETDRPRSPESHESGVWRRTGIARRKHNAGLRAACWCPAPKSVLAKAGAFEAFTAPLSAAPFRIKQFFFRLLFFTLLSFLRLNCINYLNVYFLFFCFCFNRLNNKKRVSK